MGSHPQQVINQLGIQIRTGDDDLRSQSNAYCYVRLNRNNQIEEISSQSINGGFEWANWSTNVVVFPIVSTRFPNNVKISDIQVFGIRFFSGQSNPFDTGDNWNMDSITVTYHVDNAPDDTLLLMSGSPLKRFVSDHDEWSVSFF